MPLFLGMPRKGPKEPAEDVRSYFKHLVATYHSLTPDEKKANEGLAARIDEHIQNAKNELDWDYLLELEMLILRLLPDQLIQRKTWIIRERFREAAGEQDFRDYQNSKPPNADEPKGALVADLEVVLDDLFWRHKLRTLWDRQWKRLVTAIAIGFACIAAASLAVVAAWGFLGVSVKMVTLKAVLTLAAVALAGMAGSLVSLLQRLQSVPHNQKRAVNLIGIENGRALVLQSLMTGAIFAFLMLLLFGSGLLQGGMFLNVKWTGTFLQGLADMSGTGSQLAMLLVWCFVAGFAERLVPDILDRLSKKGSAAPLFGEGDRGAAEK